MSKIIRPIHAQVGDIVRIIWHGKKDQLEEMHTAPPEETWKVRVKQKQVVDELKRSENPPDRTET